MDADVADIIGHKKVGVATASAFDKLHDRNVFTEAANCHLDPGWIDPWIMPNNTLTYSNHTYSFQKTMFAKVDQYKRYGNPFTGGDPNSFQDRNGDIRSVHKDQLVSVAQSILRSNPSREHIRVVHGAELEYEWLKANGLNLTEYIACLDTQCVDRRIARYDGKVGLEMD